MSNRLQIIRQMIADIDASIQEQLNLFLHAQALRDLEARWRGLYDLVHSERSIVHHNQVVKICCMTEKEFVRDLATTTEFEQTRLFKIIYSDEYDLAGGMPFGLMLVDIEMPLVTHHDGLVILENLMAIAGAAFLPMLLAAQPAWFQLESYGDFSYIDQAYNLGGQKLQAKINKLRALEAARYLFFVCQRYLWREPYQYQYGSNHNISFYEPIQQHEDYCWGSAIYIVARLIGMNYNQTGWFSDINQQSLPPDSFYHSNDFAKTTPLPRLEVNFFNQQSQRLSQCGLLTLQQHPISQAITIDRALAWYRPTGRISDQKLQQSLVCALTYLLCACRFAHYLKILGRHKIGSFTDAQQLQSYLQQWIFQYCGQADQFNKEQWIKYPLRSATVEIAEQSHLPGHYICRMDLKPNFRIDQIDSSLRLVSMIGRSRLA